ncbi:hypothetical protein D6S94_12270 [Salmonella enterica subsp. enterica serovar Bovismorbificans]|nr:hypothetical protein [Salmonella enterica]EAW0944513.1 hypothetical protein [Salmonella enterica]EBY8983465.1 hypothetical protein [Salmonella enterica subsp. enterica serovar Bovismorbificans]ECD2084522.1 hypothetical protein [Salmonella enterica subsp. enterica]ECI4975447.1 hypothetical protein [Salmonella enterica subsp. enterica]
MNRVHIHFLFIDFYIVFYYMIITIESVLMPLIDYIKKYYNGNQASFARLTGVQPAQVTQWLDKKFIVVDHTLYSPRRKLGT